NTAKETKQAREADVIMVLRLFTGKTTKHGGGMDMRQLLNRILPNQILNDQRLSRTRKFVYFAVRSHRKTTMKLFAAAIGIPYSSVRHCIHELKRFDWVYSFRDANTGESIYVPHMPLDLERVVAAQTEQ